MQGEVKAHEALQEHRKGCVKAGGLEYLGPIMMDQAVDAKTAVEEVWFWDKSLKGHQHRRRTVFTF